MKRKQLFLVIANVSFINFLVTDKQGILFKNSKEIYNNKQEKLLKMDKVSVYILRLFWSTIIVASHLLFNFCAKRK